MSNSNYKQKFSAYDYKKYRQRFHKYKQIKNKQNHYNYNCQNEQDNQYYSYQQKQPQQSRRIAVEHHHQNVSYDFSKLPNIVLKNIYSYLNLKEKLTASSTCSNWRNALYHPALWQNFTLKIYLCYIEDIESAYYKAKAFGKYINKLIIRFEPKDFLLLQELANILEIIKQNRGLMQISLSPIYNVYNDDYSYSHAKMINIDLANQRFVKQQKKKIFFLNLFIFRVIKVLKEIILTYATNITPNSSHYTFQALKINAT